MPPKKKTPAPKKTTARTRQPVRRKTTKPVAPETSVQPAGRSLTPLYVLLIMVLLALVVMLANQLYFKQQRTDAPASREKPRQEAQNRDRIEKKQDERRSAESDEAIIANTGDDSESGAPAQGREIAIYLIQFNEKTEKMTLVPVKRKIQNVDPVRGAIDMLIKGPTRSEGSRELLTAIPKNLRVNKVTVKNGTASIDFNNRIEESAGGSILFSRIDQIVYTATQFKEIKRVRITINGRAKKFIGSEGLSISEPLGRRR